MANEKTVRVTIEIVNKAKGTLGLITKETKDASDEMKKASKDSSIFGGELGKLAKAVGGLYVFQKATGFIKESIAAANEAEEAQALLAQTLITSRGATNEQIQSLIDQADALQRVGVVSDDSIIAAQARLASFDLETESIKKLVPSLLDYVVAEQGINASTEQFISYANGLGKALQGQVQQLTLSGFKFTEQQKLLLETGTETQRVTALTDILNSTYQGTNETMRKTAAGSLKGIKLSFEELQETIGGGLIASLESSITLIDQFGSESDKGKGIIEQFGRIAFSSGKITVSAFNLIKLSVSGVMGVLHTIQAIVAKTASGFVLFAEIAAEGLNKLGFASDETVDGIKDLRDTLEQTSNKFLSDVAVSAEDSAAAFDDLGASVLSVATDDYAASIEAHKEQVLQMDRERESVESLAKTNEEATKSYESSVKALEKIYQGVNKELETAQKQLEDLKKDYDDFVSSTTADTSKSLAQIIADAEDELPKLKKELKDAKSEEDPDREKISELKAKIKDREAVIKSAQSDEVKNFAGFQEELTFLREQKDRNEVEQTIAVFNRKIEVRKTEFEAEKKLIEESITAKEGELEMFKNIQAQTNIVLEESVATRLAEIGKELVGNQGLRQEIDKLVTSYKNLASAKSGSTSTSSLITGKRADGGPVTSGGSYLVGERGPEIFTPHTDGVIIPNKSGGGVTVNIINPSVRSEDDLRRIVEDVNMALSRKQELSQFGSYK